MFNYNTYYRNYPYSMYNYRNNYTNYNNYCATSTIETSNNINGTITNYNEKTESTSESTQNINSESKLKKENGFRLGPLTVYNDQIDIFGFSFAMDDLIIIGLMLIIFLDSDSDFVLLIILGLMLFNISFSSLNLF